MTDAPQFRIPTPWTELSPKVHRGLARLFGSTEAEAEARYERDRRLVEEANALARERGPEYPYTLVGVDEAVIQKRVDEARAENPTPPRRRLPKRLINQLRRVAERLDVPEDAEMLMKSAADLIEEAFTPSTKEPR